MFCEETLRHVAKMNVPPVRDELRFALRDLRHLYEQMLDGRVVDCKSAANGLLGPAIERLEKIDINMDDL